MENGLWFFDVEMCSDFRIVPAHTGKIRNAISNKEFPFVVCSPFILPAGIKPE